MYNIDYKNLRKGYKVNGMFFLFGLIFVLIFGGILFGPYIKILFMDSNVKAYNVQVHVGRSGGRNSHKKYSATYHYMVDGQSYDYKVAPTSTGIINPDKKFKNKDTIYYQSSNPNNCVAEYELFSFDFSYFFIVLFFSLFLFLGMVGIFNVRKRIRGVKKLAKEGTLIRGLPYKMVETNNKIKGKRIMAIQVEYELPSGDIVKLVSDPRYDLKSYDEDGLVDLLIDLNDINNYYIDFNIN